MDAANLLSDRRIVDTLPHPVVIGAVPALLDAFQLDIANLSRCIALRFPFPRIASDHPGKVMLGKALLEALSKFPKVIVKYELVIFKGAGLYLPSIQNIFDISKIRLSTPNAHLAFEQDGLLHGRTQ